MTDMAKPVSDLESIQTRYANAWRDHDIEAIVALHTEDTRYCGHDGLEATYGRTPLRNAVVATFERFPEYRAEPRRLLFGPSHWVLEWVLISGEVEFDCIDVVVLEGSLVKSRDTYFDSAQLDATIPRPRPK